MPPKWAGQVLRVIGGRAQSQTSLMEGMDVESKEPWPGHEGEDPSWGWGEGDGGREDPSFHSAEGALRALGSQSVGAPPAHHRGTC